MTNITNAMRENIVKRALEASFSDAKAALAAQEDALAVQFYELVFPENVRQAAAAMPDGWLRLDSCLRFQLGFRHIVLNCKAGVRVPSRNYNCDRLGVIEDANAVAAFEALETAKRNYEMQAQQARDELFGLLASVRTIKRLKEAWPEGAKFYAKYEEAKPGLPVPTATRINELLGLPAASAKEARQ